MLGKKSTAKQVVDFFATNLASKTAIVTGGNSGIGVETCKALASAGCRVIMCSRSVEAASKVIEEEIKVEGQSGYAVPKAEIVVKRLDLADLRAIKAFADDVLATESRIDFLVLNAGVMACPQSYTKDGFEMQIGTNHFGHFYLTQLLLPKMQAQSFPSRVVAVASMAHQVGSVDVNDLHFKNGRPYLAWPAYGQSKLANILFAKALADRLVGSQVKAVCLHPGVIETALWRNSWWITRFFLSMFVKDKNVAQGASTTLYACLSPDLEGGVYLSDCAVATPTKDAQDKALRDNLWAVTSKQIEEALSKQ